jgi:hypothetical protein
MNQSNIHKNRLDLNINKRKNNEFISESICPSIKSNWNIDNLNNVQNKINQYLNK